MYTCDNMLLLHFLRSYALKHWSHLGSIQLCVLASHLLLFFLAVRSKCCYRTIPTQHHPLTAPTLTHLMLLLRKDHFAKPAVRQRRITTPCSDCRQAPISTWFTKSKAKTRLTKAQRDTPPIFEDAVTWSLIRCTVTSIYKTVQKLKKGCECSKRGCCQISDPSAGWTLQTSYSAIHDYNR